MPPSDDKPDESDEPPLRGKLRKASDASSRDAGEVSSGMMRRKPRRYAPGTVRIRSDASPTVEEASVGKMKKTHSTEKVWEKLENLALGNWPQVPNESINRLISQGKLDISIPAGNSKTALIKWARNPALLDVLESWIGEDTLFSWLDQMRGDTDVSRFDFAVAVAALMCLRWIEVDEAEARAILEFEEGEFTEIVEPLNLLARWSNSEWSNRRHDLGDELLRILQAASAGDAASYAQRLLPGLRTFSRIDRPIQEALVQRMLMLDPTTSLGRRLGRMLIESLLKWLVKSEKGYAGEFHTPEHLVDLMVGLADPNPGERIYDPCFGTGSLLASAVRRKIDKMSATDTDGWGKVRRNGVYGREINPQVFILGLARIVYSGVDLPRLEVGNSLEVEGFNGQSESGYDCILSNPPFATRVDETTGHHFPIPMKEGDGLFLQHIVQSLRPGGRAVVLIPPGVLFSGGRMAALRKFLIEHRYVEQVIALPKGILQPYTAISVNLLVLRKDRPDDSVSFVNLSQIDLKKHEGKSIGELGNLPEAYRYRLTHRELAEREFDLVVRDAATEEVESAITELAARFPEVELRTLEEVAELRRGASYRSDQLTEDRQEVAGEPVHVLRVSDIKRGQISLPNAFLRSDELDQVSGEALLRNGDTLLTVSGTIGKIAYAGSVQSPTLVTHGIAIIRPKVETVSSRYLFSLLSSETYQRLLSSFARGTAIGHLSIKDLKQIPIPIPPIQTQSKIAEHAIDKRGDGFASLHRLLAEGEHDPIASWLEESPEVEKIIRCAQEGIDLLRLSEIQEAARSLRSLRNQVAHEVPGTFAFSEPRLLQWALAAGDAAGRLTSIVLVRDVSERFQLLHTTSLQIALATTRLEEATSPLLRRASLFARSFETLLRWQKEEISEEQSLSSFCADKVVTTSPSVVTVTIKNEGPLPLRDLEVADLCRGGTVSIPYLSAGESASVEIGLDPMFRSHDHEGILYFDIDVRATQMDESPFVTSLETGVEILEQWEKDLEDEANEFAEEMAAPGTRDSGYEEDNEDELEAFAILDDDGFDLDLVQSLADEASVIAEEAERLAEDLDHPAILTAVDFASRAASLAEEAVEAVATAILAAERMGELPIDEELFESDDSFESDTGQSAQDLAEWCAEANQAAKFLLHEAAMAKREAVEALEIALEIALRQRALTTEELAKEEGQDEAEGLDRDAVKNTTISESHHSSLVYHSISPKPEIQAFRGEPAREILGTSPYNTGSPVEEEDMLFGRDQTLEEIRTQLPSEGRANVILLEGNRRAGKTSILKRIQKPGFLPNWVVAYCSLQSGEGAKDGTGLDTAEVFRILARSIGEQLIKEGIDIWFPGHPLPDPSRSLRPQFRLATQEVFSGLYPFETFENFLIECLDAVKPKRLLLCLDEFDKLQEGIDSGVTSSQVPENIRYLIHEYPDFAAILTGSRRLKRLREEYWSALFGLGDRIGVSALAQEDAEALVTRPVERRLAYSPDSVAEIIRMTARQPFLIQSLCNRIFKLAKESETTAISPRLVKDAIQKMVEDNEHFRTLWGYAESWRRRLILALARRQEEKDSPLTFGIIHEQLQEWGVLIQGDDAIGDDLGFLEELEMLRLESEASSQSYCLEVPLFGMWIERTQDLEVIVEKARIESQREAGI